MLFKSKLIILSLMLFTLNVFSQKKKTSFDKEIDKLNCKKNKNLSQSDLEKIFPYNSSQKIVFTSYKSQNPGILGEELQKYLDVLSSKKLDSASLSKFKEFHVLNSSESFKLLDIIYNYGYKSKPTVYEGTKCYFPQNAILIVDSNDEILGFIELCFGCNKFRTNNDKITLGDECSQKYSLLKQLFIDSGILYGTVENAL